MPRSRKRLNTTEKISGVICCYFGDLERNSVDFFKLFLSRDLVDWATHYRVQQYTQPSGLIHGIGHCENKIVLVCVFGDIRQENITNLIKDLRNEFPSIPVCLLDDIFVYKEDYSRKEFLSREDLARRIDASGYFSLPLYDLRSFRNKLHELIDTGHQPIPVRQSFFKHLCRPFRRSTATA